MHVAFGRVRLRIVLLRTTRKPFVACLRPSYSSLHLLSDTSFDIGERIPSFFLYLLNKVLIRIQVQNCPQDNLDGGCCFGTLGFRNAVNMLREV